MAMTEIQMQHHGGPADRGKEGKFRKSSRRWLLSCAVKYKQMVDMQAGNRTKPTALARQGGDHGLPRSGRTVEAWGWG